MELQQAQKICKLGKKEYTKMLDDIVHQMAKNPKCHKTCYLILGIDEDYPGLFTKKVVPKENIPFISLKKLALFNPYYNFLLGYYPNQAEEILRKDTSSVYNDIVSYFLNRGTTFILQDDLSDYTYTLALINYIASFDYDLQVFINKKSIYQRKMLMIEDYAIKMILHNSIEKPEIKNFAIARFMDMLKTGEISGLTIYDNFIVCSFSNKEDKIINQSHLNPLGSIQDEAFDGDIRSLQNFINAYQRFLTMEDLIYLNNLIDGCIKDFYERIDFSLLCEESRAR